MTIADLYVSFRRKVKENEFYDLRKAQYYFGGKLITKITKRKWYYVHFLCGDVTKAEGTERIN